MKYGISLQPDCSQDVRSAADYFDDVVRLSELAEELGLDYVKMTEHYLHPAGGYCPDPLAFLAAVGARTDRIRLMTGGLQASFHHPIQIAASTAQVDAMSHGRLDVGFARAFLPYEFEAFEVDMGESHLRFRATVDTVVRLWTEQTVTASTPYFSFRDVTSLPEPTQRPHPPVWICAVMSESSFRWAGERGFNLLMTALAKPDRLDSATRLVKVYRQAFEENHGQSGRRPEVALSVPLMTGVTDEAAHSNGRAYIGRYRQVWGDAAKSLDRLDSPDYAGYREGITREFSATIDEMAELMIIGSPDTVARRIMELSEALSVDTFLWLVDLGSADYRTMERNLRTFVADVMPKVGS